MLIVLMHHHQGAQQSYQCPYLNIDPVALCILYDTERLLNRSTSLVIMNLKWFVYTEVHLMSQASFFSVSLLIYYSE